MKKFIKDNNISILMWIIFEIVAVSLFISTGKIFYLLNFTYIGTCVAVGISMMAHKKKYARNFVQIGVGVYMLVYLGIICRENMQLEGFWYYLFLGVFEAATIHYFVAKIVGPLFFGIPLIYKLFLFSLFFNKKSFSSLIILIFLPFNFFWFNSIRHLFAMSKSLKVIVAFCGLFSFSFLGLMKL